MSKRERAVLPIIMLMGPPGSGKGTQASALQERFGFERIETGAMLRAIREGPSPAARRVRELMDAGQLAPPPLVADFVIREARRIRGGGKGIVFDGSPRTLAEAERLFAALRKDRIDRVLVVVLDVPKPETLRRVLQRWICEHCQRSGPLRESTPEICDACGEKLVRRPDDTADVMEKRWEEYAFRTLPVVRFFERRGLVAHLNGDQPIPEVCAAVAAQVGERFGL